MLILPLLRLVPPILSDSQKLEFTSSMTVSEVSNAAVSKQGHEKCSEEHVSGLR